MISKYNCTVCGACSSICPVKCIKMGYNDKGFEVPVVDITKCISCNACDKVCPVVTHPETNRIKNGIAVSSKSEEVYTSSASGGAFFVIAEAFIREGGVVYGAAFKNGIVRHIRADNITSLKDIQNSKYVQSWIDKEIYESIESDLKSGTKVLFSGTACQAAAVKNYFRNNSMLYIVDLICHGVPSPLFLGRHLKSLNAKPGDKVRFRKKNGEGVVSQYCISIKDGDTDHTIDASQDEYMNMFIHGKSFNDSCYECRYANSDRAGDITIGDAPGSCIAGKNEAFTSYTGVLINTEKGEELISLLNNSYINPLNIEKYKKTNKRLSSPAKKPDDYEDIYRDIFKAEYEKNDLKKYMAKSPLKARIRRFIKKHIRHSKKFR